MRGRVLPVLAGLASIAVVICIIAWHQLKKMEAVEIGLHNAHELACTKRGCVKQWLEKNETSPLASIYRESCLIDFKEAFEGVAEAFCRCLKLRGVSREKREHLFPGNF